MKSLFIVNDFPPILGGQSSYLFNLCKALPKDKIVVLAPIKKGYKEIDKWLKFKVIRRRYVFSMPVIEKFSKIILPLFYSLRIMQKENIKYIHCAHVLSTGLIGLILKKLYKYPYIIYTHSSDILEYQKYKILRRLLKIILRNAFKVVTNSKFTKSELLSLGIPDENIIKINPHIDYDFFSKKVNFEDIIKRFGVSDKKIILSINRLIERKGNDMVIKAMGRIKKEIPKACYVIAGEGPYKDELIKIVNASGLTEDVIFAGELRQDDVVKFYNGCDVFIMASRELKDKGDAEGFGVVFLEANAAGKPVIGGDSGGIKDAVLDEATGILVKPTDIDSIANAVIRMLKDPEFARDLGERGRRRVESQFNSNIPIRELDFLFK